ncbi:hypothetical protein FSB73_05735 [Arachidicoccus ginsenosidivorans]|uniref:Lysine N(6)-hydroxylase/L-ornithine N(5)-oxygenase family protein n=1 Tax=Arachidicoccus ginsenosidivorans TaxID=496057 RepID=A0A5B8VLY5_9BACT|nr:hypothetical protein FSB73_05735 [Arachidicoccus ginsenosidivorans]
MDTIYDVIGIGIGPFNLGLAALIQTNTSINSLFIDQNESFNWHQGMMLKGTKLQVPFHADLVTLADPRNKYSFLSYLQAKKGFSDLPSGRNTFRLEANIMTIVTGSRGSSPICAFICVVWI